MIKLIIFKIFKPFINQDFTQDELDRIKKSEALLSKHGGRHHVSQRGGMRKVFKTKEGENAYWNEVLKPYREQLNKIFSK